MTNDSIEADARTFPDITVEQSSRFDPTVPEGFPIRTPLKV